MAPSIKISVQVILLSCVVTTSMGVITDLQKSFSELENKVKVSQEEIKSLHQIIEQLEKRLEQLEVNDKLLERTRRGDSCSCPPGPKGERGTPGLVGINGTKGEKGDPGPHGERGENGEIGLPGSPGPRGPQGLNGTKGEQGEAGQPGNDGQKGEQGLKGVTGGPGRNGTKGERGETGQTGNVGQKGEPGPNGDRGPRGNKGKLGITGPQGPQGLNGTKGEKGETGQPGNARQKGEPGLKGDTGVPGRNGTKGERGEIGQPGRVGWKGEPGLKGDTGVPGRKGAKGERGETGYCQLGSVGQEGPIHHDCREAYLNGCRNNGVYTIDPGCEKPFNVSCDMKNGGWTVFQSRMNGSVDFYRNWADYVAGFGHLKGEHWLGLEKLVCLTTRRPRTELRVDLVDFEGKHKYAQYSFFSIGNSGINYTLNITGYTGTAGDSLAESNGMQFTTKDRDNDQLSSGNCAINRHGAWWYKSCGDSNLNGPYPNNTVSDQGVRRHHFLNNNYISLKSAQMKLRFHN